MNDHDQDQFANRVDELFRETTPTPGFEDRIIARLRTASGPRWLRLRIHPLVRRSATAVAASLLIGTV